MDLTIKILIFSFHCEFFSPSSFCGFPAQVREMATMEPDFAPLDFKSELMERNIIVLYEQY